MFIFVDESIQERARFILASLVVCRSDPQGSVARALRRLGYEPGVDEFKSSARMDGNRRMRVLRDALAQVLVREGRLAFLVTSVSARPRLGTLVVGALRKVVSIDGSDRTHVTIAIDEGMIADGASRAAVEALVREEGGRLTVYSKVDSKDVLGIQLADLAANYCALPILERLGLFHKTVKAGPNSGYDAALDLELGWTVWARIRWRILNGGLPSMDEIQGGAEMVAPVEGYGLFVDDETPQEVAEAVRKTLGLGYLGCLH